MDETPPPTKAAQKQIDKLRKECLEYPEAWEDHPWGHIVFKVRKKMFIIIGWAAQSATVTVKLPWLAEQALEIPGAVKTGYGLGEHGWVTVPLKAGGPLDFRTMRVYIEESYRAVAPRKLVALVDAR